MNSSRNSQLLLSAHCENELLTILSYFRSKKPVVDQSNKFKKLFGMLQDTHYTICADCGLLPEDKTAG